MDAGCCRSRRSFLAMMAGVLALGDAGPARAGEGAYDGPLIDLHSHLPGPQALPALVAAMDRHGVERVGLLGVGGVQKDDLAWIEAAARRYPTRVLPFAPVPDPEAADAAARLEALLATGRFRGAGEVHVHQASRKIRRAVDGPPFLALLETCGRHGVPLVIHDELDDETTAALGRALAARPAVTIVLAHAGSGEPRGLAGLLTRHPNLQLDLSGMHFERTPALATESGHLAPEWKAFLSDHSDRVLAGIDLWAARLFAPAMLDRLLIWTRRILGELPDAAAERIAHQNARRLLRL